MKIGIVTKWHSEYFKFGYIKLCMPCIFRIQISVPKKKKSALATRNDFQLTSINSDSRSVWMTVRYSIFSEIL